MPDRVPRSNPSNDQNSKPYQQDIRSLNLYRIGINYKGAAARKLYHPKLLLDPAEGSTQKDANYAANQRDKPSLYKENPANKLIGGAQVAQGDNIIFLVDDQHAEWPNNIKGGNDQDKG